MGTYGQFCPVARAMELLDERWTMLVVRELVSGSRRFNELRRGLPRMSPSLLSRRLRTLERDGLVRRQGTDYEPTAACLELQPVIEALGVWSQQWLGRVGDADLDPHLLLWDVRRRVDLERLPPGRTVVELTFTEPEVDPGRWWLLLARDDVDVCDVDPGHDVDLWVAARLRTLTDVWLGHDSWEAALARDDLVVDGPTELRRGLPTWLQFGVFADAAPARLARSAGRA